MPFLLSGSPNDVKSGDLKIKPETSNVLDPIEPVFECSQCEQIIQENNEATNIFKVTDLTKEQINKLKYYVRHGYRPIIKTLCKNNIGGSRIDEYLRFSIYSREGEVFYGWEYLSVLTLSKEIAYFTNTINGYFDSAVFDVGNETLYVIADSNIIPNFNNPSSFTIKVTSNENIQARRKAVMNLINEE